ncbi:DNA-binding response regulator [Streptomyces inhibens]|uniref:DNA-binding response regulator n=1 Tax=Streptomyces inhibens TaxID=2293571 RepID=A0A371PXF4_STRIH|nr:response regulator transcription factor [Streptomyces inhibens]REK87160.1 DNA-binding response regulator [Streptomyces inhibens]
MTPSAAEPAHSPVRVLLCDDHAVVRAGLLALLSSAHGIEVIGEAGNGEEAVVMAAKLRPDVVLMDLQLGSGIDGIEATRRITGLRPDHPETERPETGRPETGRPETGRPETGRAGADRDRATPHVLVLTTYDTDADITRAIEAGATGYLLKAERPEELFSAIRAAAQGRSTLSAPVAHRVLAQMRSPRPTLTDRELDILGQLARGLSNREIARALFISEATVKTHLGRIYDKLGVDTRAGAVSVAKEQRLLP